MKVFVRSLLDWLANPANATILRWNEEGTTFHVIDSERFMEELYRKKFNAARYASFKRQLNIYDFRCRDEVFVHPHFRRDGSDYHLITKKKGVRFQKSPTKLYKAKKSAIQPELTGTGEAPDAAAPDAAAPDAAAPERTDPFKFNGLHLFSSSYLVDLMIDLDFAF